MKRIFTFFAALCCTMFFSIARATALEDGAIIYVGLEKMSHEDVEGWTPTGVSGAIVYDEENHVLTLNELAFTEPLDIDASAFWDAQFTIRIEGTAMTTFEMQAQTAIRFRGGHGLIIEGDKGTGLSININNVSGNGGCGIMCATTFSTSMSTSDYLPLTIQGGVSVGVNNYGANENQYAAVIAYPVTIKNSDLSAATTDGTGIAAVQTATGISGVTTTNSQWMNYDEYDDYFWEWKAYTVVYYVAVNGYHLTDRRSSLSSSDMTNIKSGSITYDPETNVLELKGGFELDVHDGSSDGIVYEGSEPLTIRVSAVGSTSVSETSMTPGKAALRVSGPVILDLEGCNLELTSTYGSGIRVEDELTIQNTWGDWEPYDAEKKTLTIDSPVGLGILGDASDAKMTIDHTNVVVGGGAGSVIKVPTTLNGVTLPSDYHWNAENSIVDDTDTEVADPMSPVHFNLSEWKLVTSVWPEDAGKIQIEVDETIYDNEYAFTENKSASLTPAPNDGWEFYDWEDGNQVTPRSINLLVSDGSMFRGANFMHLIESETQWYTVVNVGGTRSIFPLNDKLRTLGDKIADLTPSDERSIVCAGFADGNLYYIETNSIGNKSWLVKAAFDGTTLGTPEIITADDDADKYSFFYNIAYSFRDNCFYGVCRNMALSTDVLVRIALDGTITEVIDITSGSYLDAMVVDEDGKLYTFFNSNKLNVLDPVSLSATSIGEVELMLPGASSTAMFYDYATGEMLIFDDDFFWRIDKTNGKVVPVWPNSALATNCIFSMASPGTQYTVTVQSADETKGTVSPSGTKKYKENATLVLTPTPKKGFKFVEWQEDHNTDNPRTITVTADATYTAVFDNDPDFTYYDVFVGEEQFYSGRLTMTKENNANIKNEGTIVFDPTTNTLSLNAVELQTSVGCIRAGANEALDLDIIVNGDCKLTSNPMFNGILIYGKKLVTFQAGTDNPKLSVSDQVAISDADLEIIGLTSVFQGTDFSLVGWSNNSLIITGANVTAKGAADATISNWESVEYRYCSVLPTDIIEEEGMLHINSDDHVASKSTDAPCKSDIYFTPLPKLTVKPFQEGSAHFKLQAGNDEFIDEGYFAAGTTVTITCEPASDYAFGRWIDDLDWTDKTKKLGVKREFVMPASNKELEALCYFVPESDADWFAINGDEFVKFSFNDHAEKAARATNSLTNIKAGDWFDDTWVFVEGTDVKQIPFSGTLEDGKDIKGDIKDYNKESLSGVTDMAYDLASEELYAVAGSKLYRVTTKENKEVATFKLDEVETPVVAIAFDADGNLFALGAGDGTEGVLYSVSLSKDEAKLKIVGKKDNGGKIGIKVNNAPQSLVFDAQTGELFWGAPDYLRLINMDKMKTFIVGDLGQKAGMQGYVQSLHRMIELVEVTVKVADDQEDWGVVYLNDDKSTVKNPTVSASFVEGTPVTIKAEANDGYHFVEWLYLDGKKEKSFKDNDKETYDFEASNITYVAYFEEDEEAIENIIAPEGLTEKRLVDGTIYILRNGSIYTLTGEKVK